MFSNTLEFVAHFVFDEMRSLLWCFCSAFLDITCDYYEAFVLCRYPVDAGDKISAIMAFHAYYPALL